MSRAFACHFGPQSGVIRLMNLRITNFSWFCSLLLLASLDRPHVVARPPAPCYLVAVEQIEKKGPGRVWTITFHTGGRVAGG